MDQFPIRQTFEKQTVCFYCGQGSIFNCDYECTHTKLFDWRSADISASPTAANLTSFGTFLWVTENKTYPGDWTG